jgi:hypothetical protein
MASDNLRLFDDDTRTYTEYAGYSESSWTYINRVARPGYVYLRDLLQNWFDEYNANADKRRKCGFGQFGYLTFDF